VPVSTARKPPVSERKPPVSERVMDAARDLFYAEGYDVTVDAIAQRASVAKPTVYVHFGSKEALIEAVLEAASADFFGQLEREVAARPGDPVARLLTPIDMLTASLPDPAYHGCLCVNAAAAFPDPGHPAHRVLRDLNRRLLDTWATLAAQAGARRPGALARQLLLVFDGVKARGLTDSTGAAAEDARAAALALLDVSRRTGPAAVSAR
jgi:AcrR family transcriptional regulator